MTVRDRGVGFEPSQSLARGHNGSGFGLLAIRERFNWLGGTFQIDGRPGEGTCAVLTAPIALGVGPAAQAEPSRPAVRREHVEAAGPGDAKADRKIRVLLADDHAVMRDGLGGLLQRLPDMEVIGKAADGQEAVDLVRQLQPDVIVMDVSMPKLDGLAATRQIKAASPQVHVIGLSMFNEDGMVEGMKSAGAARYLAKSSGPAALIEAIRECVAGKVEH